MADSCRAIYFSDIDEGYVTQEGVTVEGVFTHCIITSCGMTLETRFDSIDKVLLRFRILHVALILALWESERGHTCGKDHLIKVREMLTRFIGDIPSVPTMSVTVSAFDAVRTEARLALEGLENLDSMPSSASLMSMEAMWARGRILELGGYERDPVPVKTRHEDVHRYVDTSISGMKLMPANASTDSLRDGLKGLATIDNSAVTTLNYDGVLEVVLDLETCGTCVTECVLEQAVRDKNVIHLHSTYGKDTKYHYTLTHREYCASHTSFMSTLGYLLHLDLAQLGGDDLLPANTPNKSLVFVGCAATLEDPHFLALFERLNMFQGQQHFVVGRSGEGLEEMIGRICARFPHVNLTFISYGTEYDQLGPFLLEQAQLAAGGI
ncbi:hypothetical protein KIPB_010003 [Kipferlia bialata]|uniref:Uncharacterized protein n=1 Tax=Kipferlia bialata TaxID=797122 RepID=A0A391P5K7_9EUKA|nr:hypothetical protein KIPB_010003 [Kipferlia bialata]|eukprot:g10003.t1